MSIFTNRKKSNYWYITFPEQIIAIFVPYPYSITGKNDESVKSEISDVAAGNLNTFFI